MKIVKKIIKKTSSIFFAVLTFALPLVNIMEVQAQTMATLVSGAYIRSTPSTASIANKIGTLSAGTAIDVIETVSTIDSSTGCDTNQWFKFMYNGVVAYSCTSNFDLTNKYGRPWTTPKKAIVGGAIFKAEKYISKGQFTSYLVKFNVNPAAYYAVYTHQYMTNVRAPYSEARTSYGIYVENNLLNQPLVFSIPIYTGMPEYTILPEGEPDTGGMTAEELNDATFETYLDSQGFDETYKKKLRVLHIAYPNWTFESMKTNLDWNTSINAEQPISYVDGDNFSLRESYAQALADAGSDNRYNDVCKNSTGPYCLKEGSNWYLANTQTTAYFMDPRNFLNVERILMFEKLAYSPIYTEQVIQSRLDSTFMSGISALDNQTYASIFVEAGQAANISAVYLTSQCLQEVGTNGSVATTGAQFTYNGITYQGLYNFFNVGATDAYSPAKSGLFWANAGSTQTVVSIVPDPTTTESAYISALGLAKTTSYITGVALSQVASSITSKLANANVSVTDANGASLSSNSKLTTGSKIVISDADHTYTNTVVIYGDLSGDGEINAIDLLYMRKHLLKTYNLTGPNLQAAKIAKGSDVGAADLLYLRKYLLDNQTYKITQ